MICAICAILGIAADAAMPTITGVTAQQRYPWNGKVDISYTVSGDIAAVMKAKGQIASLKVTVMDNVADVAYVASSLSGDMTLTEGTHSIVWDMDADGLSFKSSNVVFNVAYETTNALYCVIDLSGGANASSYPITYLTEPPSGGFNVDEYKFTKLVLRRIEQGSFAMGGQYNVTLTKPFYVGVFEVTQPQYALVMGSNPSEYTSSVNARPVESVSYNTIRGSSNGAQWPSSSAVDATSFMGKLRTRTGLDFDLPTEAQWEYACRAGTTSKYNNGGNSESDLKQLGRYVGNTSDGRGGDYGKHTPVGSYLPNAWGLYDMHGNVWEWCLDWYGSLLNEVTDPHGSAAGSGRASRGGSFGNDASWCTSSIRNNPIPSFEGGGTGFRLCRTIYPEGTLCTVTYDANGGVGNMVPQPLAPGREPLLPCAFTRENYAFAGWATETNGPVMYSDCAVASIADDVTLYAVWEPANYCVIDLSAGASATSYPITHLADAPTGGFNVDEFKTTKIVLRRIEPGSFLMGGQYNVTLTKSFYMGVFEVTQKQYELVMGSNPSEYKGDKRPVEKVSYNMIRGSSDGAQWPASSAVDSTSFFGKLRMRTGLEFDLPTDAQWEYSCRAGTTSKYNNGGDSENDLKQLGRYSGNTSDGKGGDYSKHTPVGSYLPNAWGLYDMHGNVWEWCLDWYSSNLSDGVTDPQGPPSANNRMRRGGGWAHEASLCTSSLRASNTSSYQNHSYGFRLCLPFSE